MFLFCSGSLRFNMKVAPILKDHLNTNACVSVIVRAKRAERCLCVCGGGGDGACCVYGGPHIEGPPQHQCKCQCHCKLKVSGRKSAWPYINLLLPCNFSLKPRIKFLLVACTAVRRHGRGIGRRYVVWHWSSWTNFASRLSQTIQKA